MSKNLVWFITGCSSGFGLELSKHLLQAGYFVVVTARNIETLKEVVSINTSNALALTLDVTKQDQIDASVKSTISRFGRLDVLVNNAGFSHTFVAIEECGEKNIRDIFDVNFFGLISVTNAFLPYLRKQRSGHIVNISSNTGINPYATCGPYSASKFAIFGISEAYKKELESFNIRVTVVAPSGFRTNFLHSKNPLSEPIKVIDDYKEIDATSINQGTAPWPGSPVEAAKLIEKVVLDPKSPFRVFIGARAVKEAQARGCEITADADALEKEGIACDAP